MAAGAVSLWRREAVFLTAMLVSETGIVGMHTLFKAATSKGLNSYAFLAYSYLLASILLLPCHLFSNRSRSLPPLSFAILSKIGLLGLLGSMFLITGYIGVKYSNPTLASAISNITPALTFILAIIFSLIGGVLITLGFYAVAWGKTSEDKTRLLSLLEKEETPLLSNHNHDQI